MGLLSLRRPADLPLQNTTRRFANEALKRELISPELYAKLTAPVIESADVEATKRALREATTAHLEAAGAAQDMATLGWRGRTPEDREQASADSKALRKEQHRAAEGELLMRALMDAVGVQVKDQSAAMAIASSFRRWSSVGE